MLCHSGGTASFLRDVAPADTQFAMNGYCHCNSALCHPVQFSLILFCITHSASFVTCPLIECQTLRCPEAIKGDKPTHSVRFRCFLFKHQSQNLCSQQDFSFFSLYISKQQNTIDVSTCNTHFHGWGIAKGNNSGFQVHRQCIWEFIACSSLREWGTADTYITSHYWNWIILMR